MKHWIDSLTLGLLAFSAGYMARELSEKQKREAIKKALTEQKDKLRSRVEALTAKRSKEDEQPVIEIERADGTLEVVDEDFAFTLTGETASVLSTVAEEAAEEEEASDVAEMPEEVRECAQILCDTLKSFGIALRDRVDWSCNSFVMRIELYPEVGVTVRSIINRTDDISLALRAPVRIVAPIPGKSAVGVEVPCSQPISLNVTDLWKNEKYAAATAPLTVPFGVDVSGDVYMMDLAKMPHLLIAGGFCSGKSVFVTGLLAGLIRRNSPETLRLLLIDPKQVELSSFAHVPHLLAPVITDLREGIAALKCVIDEMERRFVLMRDAGVFSIQSYNSKMESDPNGKQMPYLVVVVDELADLKMVLKDDRLLDRYLCRIAQKARAAGIHLILSTHRTAVDVITGILKANIHTRLAFRVNSPADSRTILDANGAEVLMGRGDALLSTPMADKPIRLHCPYIADDELQRLTAEARESFSVCYDGAFMDAVKAEIAEQLKRESEEDIFAPDEEDFDEDEEDPKFREAVILAYETQKIAASLLQRRLGIGYGRASKIIDRMEALGYVSAADGNRPRKVLVGGDVIREMLNHTDGDEE